MHLVRTFPVYFPKIHSNTIFPSTPLSSEWSVLFILSNQNFVCISSLCGIFQRPGTSSLLMWIQISELSAWITQCNTVLRLVTITWTLWRQFNDFCWCQWMLWRLDNGMLPPRVIRVSWRAIGSATTQVSRECGRDYAPCTVLSSLSHNVFIYMKWGCN